MRSERTLQPQDAAECALLGASQVKGPPADEERFLGREPPRRRARRPVQGPPGEPRGQGAWGCSPRGPESDTAERLSTRSRGFLGEPRPETRGAWEEPAEFSGHKENWSPGKREGPRTVESLGPAPRAGEPLETAQSGLGRAAAASPDPEEAPHGPQSREQRPGQAWSLPDAKACTGLCRRNGTVAASAGRRLTGKRPPGPARPGTLRADGSHAGVHVRRLSKPYTYRLCLLSHESYDSIQNPAL